VLAGLLAAPRLEAALARMRRTRALVTTPSRPTPFAFPLVVELFREKLTTAVLEERGARMVADLEKAAGDATSGSADPEVAKSRIRSPTADWKGARR
jgi:ATP-dependent Lhr-like helicase